MTWNEKNTIINALGLYRDSQMRKARKARKNLEMKKAADTSIVYAVLEMLANTANEKETT